MTKQQKARAHLARAQLLLQGHSSSPYNTSITSNEALGFGVNGSRSSAEHNPNDWPDVPNTWIVQKWYDSYNMNAPGYDFEMLDKKRKRRDFDPIYIGLKSNISSNRSGNVYVELDGNKIHEDPLYGQIFIGKLASDSVLKNLSVGTSVALRMVVDQDKAEWRLDNQDRETILETRQQESRRLDKMLECLIFLQENDSSRSLKDTYGQNVERLQGKKNEADRIVKNMQEELQALDHTIAGGWLIRDLAGLDLKENMEDWFDSSEKREHGLGNMSPWMTEPWKD